MKFWELQALAHNAGNPAILRAVAETDPGWSNFADWSRDYASIVDAQDRGKLDHEIADDFCRAVITQLSITYYLSKGVLRSRRFSITDRKLSALETFDRFGGSAMEEVQEKGSLTVGEPA